MPAPGLLLRPLREVQGRAPVVHGVRVEGAGVVTDPHCSFGWVVAVKNQAANGDIFFGVAQYDEPFRLGHSTTVIYENRSDASAAAKNYRNKEAIIKRVEVRLTEPMNVARSEPVRAASRGKAKP